MSEYRFFCDVKALVSTTESYNSFLMFTNILKYTTLQKVKISYSSVHQKLQNLLYQQLEELSNEVMGLKRQVKKKKK